MAPHACVWHPALEVNTNVYFSFNASLPELPTCAYLPARWKSSIGPHGRDEGSAEGRCEG